MPSLDQIAVHRSERGLVLGGTGTGKSTLVEYLMQHFLAEFPRGRVLVLDSKPRFRAEWLPDGTSAERRYKRWGHGEITKGSMAVSIYGNPRDALNTAWMMKTRIAIAQTDNMAERLHLLRILDAFFKQAHAKRRQQLVVVDETLDFFHGNGSPLGGNDAILRVARAGRELGVSGLFGSQRAKGIPIQLRSELSQAYIFRLDHGTDVRELWEFGYPRDAQLPTEKFQFSFWHKENQRVPELCYLNL